jgi:recombination protein RecR
MIDGDGDDPVRDLVRLLTRLPGLGEKSARRIAHHLLNADTEYAERLGRAVATLAQRVRRCGVCGNFTSRAVCALCTDPKRHTETLCVVARPMDVDAIERRGSFRGATTCSTACSTPSGASARESFRCNP